jgi:hypothetical protein
MRRDIRRWSGVAVLAAVIALSALASACSGTNDHPGPAQSIARTPTQALRLYNRAIVSGDYAVACRLLTRLGQANALNHGRQLARPFHKPRPSTCAAALEVIVPETPSYRKLERARMVRVRPNRDGEEGEVLVTQRFADGMLEDVLVRPQDARWVLVLNPYSALA